ncbi:hypothetical protein [Thermogymnomonas acidicola]|uniref:hypothetical protein n=1 Tax=Thermogymnomonas acidicola TaxID=399579 RepID=UPI001663F859|nr:hypothetical protein [Thermogymnomonas acidicola]
MNTISVVIRSIEFHSDLNLRLITLIGRSDRIINVVRGCKYEVQDPRLTILVEPTDRFEAFFSALKVVDTEYVLLIDEDQIPSEKLFDELRNIKADFAIVPERSINRNICGRMMDIKRKRVEELAKMSLDPLQRAVPRFYRTDILKAALNGVDSRFAPHEDSFIFSRVLETTKSYTVLKSVLYNYDVSLRTYMLKSYKYGAALGRNENPTLGKFALKMDLSIMIGRQMISLTPIDLVRAFPYALGYLVGKFRRRGISRHS